MITSSAIVQRPIDRRILEIRGQKVLLDRDIAELYGVAVKRLNEQVKRNSARFPADFMFRLTNEEYKKFRSQNATSKYGRGGRRYAPFAFTEHGAIMAATVLNSQRAIQMSVFVVRAFLKLRELLATNKEVAKKLQELEERIESHDDTILDIISALRRLTATPVKRARQIGFKPANAPKPKALKASAGT